MSLFDSITILNKIPRAKKVGGIVIDGLLEESHSNTATATRLPIEDGSTISDHVTVDPDSVTIKGVITNTPLFATLLQGGSLSGLFGDRVTSAFEGIRQLMKDRKLLTVSTSLKVYTDMIIESFTPSKNGTTGQSMEFSMTLTKIKVVKSQTTNLPNTTIGGDMKTDQLQAQANVSQGQTVGKVGGVVAEGSETSDSILSLVSEGLGKI